MSRLHVLVSGKEMVFKIENPKSIVVRNAKDGYVDFQCGPMTPTNVDVFYVPESDPSSGGNLRDSIFSVGYLIAKKEKATGSFEA